MSGVPSKHKSGYQKRKEKKRDCKVEAKDCRLCFKRVSVQMDVTTALQSQRCLLSNQS